MTLIYSIVIISIFWLIVHYFAVWAARDKRKGKDKQDYEPLESQLK